MRLATARLASLAALAAALLLAGCHEQASCPAGETSCGGICFDLQADERSCGTCLHHCPTGATCQAGQCLCPAGQIACGGACVDPQVSDAHCGGCDQPCGTGTCVGGACDCGGSTACPAAGPGEPRCADTAGDVANCGTCGHACRAFETCSAGTCTCSPPRQDCSFGCTDPTTTAAHCGATCGAAVPCPAGATCAGGSCACPAARPTTCGATGASPGTCVDTATDEANCGTCGRACATGATCSGGTCACPSGQVACGAAPGRCVDPQTDEANCGGCGASDPRFVCGAGEVCTSGACCLAGQLVCRAATTCCAGTACCGSAGTCQPAHSNGLGQTYFSCDPLGTMSRDAALAAAQAWSPSGGTILEQGLLCAGCLCLQQTTQAATWCYDGLFIGQVSLNTISTACLCPPAGNTSGPWN